MAKNFLRCFNCYLTNKDFQLIRKNYSSKGYIISKTIKNLFQEFDGIEKLKIVLDLINKSFSSLTKGNNFVHSNTIDNYENEISQYKQKK